MTVGEKIAHLRRQRGWTQSEFAEKVGVHANHVSRWESNRMRPSEMTLHKIVTVFGISAAEMEDVGAYVPSTRNNKMLAEKVELLLDLDAEDQNFVFRIIDSLAMQKRVARLVAPAAR